jgi:hypothetical protein
MSKYPKWKILKLDEYTGPLSNKVFAFLDDLSTPPPSAYDVLGDAYNPRQLTEKDVASVFQDIGSRAGHDSDHPELAKAVCKHISKMHEVKKPWTLEEKEEYIRLEIEGLQKLHKEFGHLPIPSFLDVVKDREKDMEIFRHRAKVKKEEQSEEARQAILRKQRK